MNLEEQLQARREKLKTAPSAEAVWLTADKALKKALGTSPALPAVKLAEGATVVEVLERLVQSLKEEGVHPTVSLPKVVGKVVEEKEKEGREWVTPDYWKENIVQIEDKTKSGALIVPKHWNRNCILLLHGFRAEGPELIADLAIDEHAISEVIKDGWIVAMTSYRRNGRVVRDAMEDVNQLRQYIVDHYGQPSLCLLEGRSMGGCIATCLAENYPHLYQGAVAIGAALDVIGDNEERMHFTHKPEFPILYLTNQSELGKIHSYIDSVKENIKKNVDRELDIFLPALWEVWREGHNQVSQEERLAAWKSLKNWVEHGTFITVSYGLARTQNIFINAQPRHLPVFVDHTKKEVTVKVISIHPVWKIFYIGCQSTIFDQLGIRIGKEIVFRNKRTGKSIEMLYTSYPFFCPRDTWMVVDHPDGIMFVESFTYDFRDHAGMAGVQLEDEIVITEKKVAPDGPKKITLK